jgi:flagellar biosynthesis/type III secretory pathway chaperone
MWTKSQLDKRVAELQRRINNNLYYIERADLEIWRLDNLTNEDTSEDQDKLLDFIERLQKQNRYSKSRMNRAVASFNKQQQG